MAGRGEDVQTGILVEPESPVALGEAILVLLEGPMLGRRMGEFARQRIAERFSLNRQTRLLLNTYERMWGMVGV